MEEKKNQLENKDAVSEASAEVKIVKEVAPYKLYGCDVSTADESVKQYYKESMMLIEQANLMLGNFDDNGNYIISKEIKRDVVVMDKEIEEIGDTFFRAASLYMKKNFYFLVSLSKLPDGKGKAKLYLYEYVGDFLEREFVVSHIANFVDVYDENFVGKVRKAFNLVDVDVPNNEFQTKNLAVKMQQLLDDQVKVGDLQEAACQAFVMRLLKCLENNVKGRLIIAEFKKLLAKYKGTLSFKMQKALLDKVINRLGGYEVMLKDNPEAQLMLKEFLKSCSDIEKAKKAVAVKEEKQAEEKAKAAPAKSGGGGSKKPAAKKSGGGDKKKDNKKKKAGGKDDGKKKSSGHLSDAERRAIAAQVAKEYAKYAIKIPKVQPEKTDERPEQQKEEKKPVEEIPKEETPDVIDLFASMSANETRRFDTAAVEADTFANSADDSKGGADADNHKGANDADATEQEDEAAFDK